MAEETHTRDIKRGISPRIKVASTDFASGAFTANSQGRAPFANSVFTSTQLANDAKSRTIQVWATGDTSTGSGTIMTLGRMWQNNGDASLTIGAIQLVNMDAVSVDAGTTGPGLRISLFAGTTRGIASMNRNTGIAASTTTTLTAGSTTVIRPNEVISMNMRLVAVSGTGVGSQIGRYTKILVHCRTAQQ